MKKRAIAFICIALLILMLVPIINLSLGNVQQNKDWKWWSRSALYNFDFALPYFSQIFYSLGISLEPGQVIIGKNDWLYLGDDYGKTITSKRQDVTEQDLENIQKINLATQAWDRWLKQKGVHIYKIMIGPDKETIYPEYLPNWVQPVTTSPTDILLANVNQELYFDSRPALKAAKLQYPEPLYSQIDTHWNQLGAWVAFNGFINQIAHEEGLRYFSGKQIQLAGVNEGVEKDLASFLHMEKLLTDKGIVMEIDNGRAIPIEQFDFETKQIMLSGDNLLIDITYQPWLIKSESALNQKKVLWLRDSFGTGMSLYMAATFTETLQLHYGAVTPTSFSRLVETYQPDYVFITVVERAARGPWFTHFPPES